MLVSLLLPTRGRGALVRRSLESVRDTAANPDDIEIMLGLDDDDTANGAAAVQACRDLGLHFQAHTFPPLGYAKLHHYDNTMAVRATGDWLFLWNDDVVMETNGWDAFLRQERGSFVVFDPKVSNGAAAFEHGLFPIVPRRWVTTVGHLSASPQVDTYVTMIARILDRYYAAPFSVFHDRYDETGNNNDATFQARVYQTEAFYTDQGMCDAMNWDAEKLCRMLEVPRTQMVRQATRAELAATP